MGGKAVRPLVAIDVDGVLLPFGQPWKLNPKHGEWLLSLADRADLVWASSWEYLANTQIGPEIGLPQIPVVEFNSLDKVPSLERWAHGRPLAWVDDFYGASPGVIEWAGKREAKTLLIAPAPNVGLERWHIDRISGWLNYLNGEIDD